MMPLLILLDVAAKAAQMAERDPHGWIMSLVAVSVVFLSLFILQYCYRFIGWLNKRESGEKKVTASVGKKGKTADAEVAAAIATALTLDSSGEVQAAIALALDRYFSESIHDRESYIITIRRI